MTLHAHELDPRRPNPARMYDYFLGGYHNFEADRQAAEAAEAAYPGVRAAARANRDFLRRAVRYLVSQGIDQFLDLGSGVPTAGNVHEIAQAVNPNARVVYVDAEPVVVHASEALLTGNAGAEILHADIRHADAVLASRPVEALIDLTRPIGLMMVSVLQYIPDTDNNPERLLGRYLSALPSGSFLALSHPSLDGSDIDGSHPVYKVYNATTSPVTSRDQERIASWFDSLELVEPGVVTVTQWHADPSDGSGRQRLPNYGGVARIP
jgi:hypothetical protein